MILHKTRNSAESKHTVALLCADFQDGFSDFGAKGNKTRAKLEHGGIIFVRLFRRRGARYQLPQHLISRNDAGRIQPIIQWPEASAYISESRRAEMLIHSCQILDYDCISIHVLDCESHCSIQQQAPRCQHRACCIMPPYHHESLAMCQVLDFWAPPGRPQELRITAFTSKSYDELKVRDRKREHKKLQKAGHMTQKLRNTRFTAACLSNDAQYGDDNPRSPATSSTIGEKGSKQTSGELRLQEDAMGSMCEPVHLEATAPFDQQSSTTQPVLIPHHSTDQEIPSAQLPSTHMPFKQPDIASSPSPLAGSTSLAHSNAAVFGHSASTIGATCDDSILLDSRTISTQARLDVPDTDRPIGNQSQRRLARSPLSPNVMKRLISPLWTMQRSKIVKSNHRRDRPRSGVAREHGRCRLVDSQPDAPALVNFHSSIEQSRSILAGTVPPRKFILEAKKASRDKLAKGLTSITCPSPDVTPQRKSRCGRSISRPRRYLPEEGYA